MSDYGISQKKYKCYVCGAMFVPARLFQQIWKLCPQCCIDQLETYYWWKKNTSFFQKLLLKVFK